MKSKYIYIQVTNDKYEFPVLLADTPKEMAEKAHTTPARVRADISRQKKGVKSKFKRVEVTEDEID